LAAWAISDLTRLGKPNGTAGAAVAGRAVERSHMFVAALTGDTISIATLEAKKTSTTTNIKYGFSNVENHAWTC